MADGGDNHVHLCLYFLDPDHVLPPAAPTPPAPLVSRSLSAATSGSGYPQTDPEPVILEPPVASKPLPPNLSQNDINTIRRLSTRVNVLPVIGRADTLSNERLAAVKMAVRKDLAAVGIGFGVFDLNPTDIYHPPRAHSVNGDLAGSTRKQQQQPHNGRASAPGAVNGISPPASPPTPLLRLPYALISPDLYSHSDGVPRIQPPRHEILNHYFPFQQRQPSSPPSSGSGSSALPKGVYTRTYRWGALDVLDPNHNDFVPLRAAIFQQMGTLQKYTRDYLLDKYRTECPPARHAHNSHPHSHPYPTPQSQPQLHHPLSVSHLTSPGPEPISSRKPSQQQLPPLTPASRPILAIDTQASGAFGSSSRSLPPHNGAGPDSRTLPPGSAHDNQQRSPYVPKASIPSPTQHLGVMSLGGINKQRQKKITVACNFCRSRKLKCDGGRPACSQCIKRSVNCDYISTPHGQNSRRRTKNHRRDVGASGSGGASGGGQGGGNGGDSDSELSDAEERSPDGASMSPEVPAEQLRDRERGYHATYQQPQHLHHHSHHQQHHQPHHHPHQPMGVPKLHEYPNDIYHKTTGRPPSSNSGHREHDSRERDRERDRDRDRDRDNNAKPYYSSEYDLPAIVSLPPPPPAPGSPVLPPTGHPQRAGSAGPPATGSGASPAARPRAAPVTSGPTSRPRQPSTTGPKVVACNNCRARKTKCDGAHPACTGCVRRSLACNYVHDGNGTGRRGGTRRASAPNGGNGGGGGGGGGGENGSDASPGNANPNASLRPAPSSRSNSGDNGHGRGENEHRPGSEENRAGSGSGSGSGSNGHELALKRPNINDREGYDYESSQPYKKSRIDLDPQLLPMPPQTTQQSSSVSGVA